MRLNLAQQLEQYVKKKSNLQTSRAAGISIGLYVKREMALYESGKNYRPELLEKLHQSFLTLRPTSVEPDRAFSSRNLFVTKIFALSRFRKMKSDKSSRIDQYFAGKQNDENLIPEIVAVDRFHFNRIAKSKIPRKGPRAVGYEIPATRNGVAKVFMKQYANEKMKVAYELKELRDQGIRFSITLDESTSVSMERLYNLNVHYASEFQSLGTMPVKGSCSAEKVVELTKERLKLFNLDLNNDNDIVGARSDGGSIMKNFGRLLDIIHVTCLAHGIHLSVVNVLYEFTEYGFEGSDSSANEEELLDDEDVEAAKTPHFNHS